MRKAADMIAAANDIITVVTAEDAIAMHEKGEVSFIDIREMPGARCQWQNPRRTQNSTRHARILCGSNTSSLQGRRFS